MLDAYIIRKIKQEKEAETSRAPLHIEVPVEQQPPEEEADSVEEDPRDRGVVIVDYSV
jgi:hypothetical protein